jgi:hypothetical protein
MDQVLGTAGTNAFVKAAEEESVRFAALIESVLARL